MRAFARRAKNLKDSKNAGTGLLCLLPPEALPGAGYIQCKRGLPHRGVLRPAQGYHCPGPGPVFLSAGSGAGAEGVESADFLRLVLNALHFLCRGTRPQAVLKAIVELRMLSEAGYMPSIAYCAHCGAYESERMYFKVNRGEIYCKSCYLDNGDPCAPLSPAALTAMRHIVFSDFEKSSPLTFPPVPGRSWLLRQRPIPCRSCSTAQDLGLLLQPAVSGAFRESRQEAL